jgi:hypothetical protein
LDLHSQKRFHLKETIVIFLIQFSPLWNIVSPVEHKPSHH